MTGQTMTAETFLEAMTPEKLDEIGAHKCGVSVIALFAIRLLRQTIRERDDASADGLTGETWRAMRNGLQEELTGALAELSEAEAEMTRTIDRVVALEADRADLRTRLAGAHTEIGRLQDECLRIAEERDARPAITREDAALVRLDRRPWSGLDALEQIATAAATNKVSRALSDHAKGGDNA